MCFGRKQRSIGTVLLALAAGTLLVASGCTGARKGSSADTLGWVGLRLGESRRYLLDWRGDSTVDLFALFAKARSRGAVAPPGARYHVVTALDGEVSFVALGRQADATLLLVQPSFTRVDLEIEGRQTEQQVTALTEDLRHDLLLELTDEGRVRALHFDRRMGPLARDVVRPIVAALQIVRRRGDPSLQWEAQEEDPAGAYMARYRAMRDAGAVTLTKEKLRYVPPRGSRRGGLQVANVTRPVLDAVVKLDTDRVPVSFSARESRTDTVATMEVGKSETSLELQLVDSKVLSGSERQAALDRGAALHGVPAENVRDGAARRVAEQNMLEGQLGGADAAQLLAALSKLDEGPAILNQQVVDQIRALALLHPSEITALGKRLEAAPPTTASFRLLARGLSSAGNREAQDALVAAIGAREADPSAVHQLLPALGSVPEPTQASVEAVRRLALSPDHSTAGNAMLALGTMAGNLEESAPGRSDELVTWLIGRLDGSRDDAARRVAVIALGNAGSPKSLSTLRPLTQARDPALRAAAVLSLRFVEGADADALVLKALDTDEDRSVRLQAATALRFRDLTGVSTSGAARALLKDSAVEVRRATVEVLAKAGRENTEAAKALEKASRDDPSPQVREAAQQALYRKGPQ